MNGREELQRALYKAEVAHDALTKQWNAMKQDISTMQKDMEMTRFRAASYSGVISDLKAQLYDMSISSTNQQSTQ